MTDCWQVLGLEATDDRRAVKRAYSRKLKVTRPDDDPVAFQQLHAAYQAALDQVEYGLTEAEPSAEWPVDEASADVRIDWPPMAEFDDPAPAEPALTEDQAAELKLLLAQMDALLHRPLQLQNPDNWDFLVESPHLLDDRFRIELGAAVINRIVAFNGSRSEQRGAEPLSSVVLTRLDEAFLWSLGAVTFGHRVDDWDAFFDLTSQIETSARRPPAMPLGGEVIAGPDRRTREPTPSSWRDHTGDWMTYFWIVLGLLFVVGQFARAIRNAGGG